MSTRLPSLGRRGEGWVALQVLSLASVGAAGLLGPRWPAQVATAVRIAGLALTAAGATLGIAGVRALGDALSPFPAPTGGAGVREEGAYGLVRHPIYGALLLVSLGWSCLTSPVALVPAVILAIILEGKRRLEEAWLSQRHEGYARYAQRVRHRFIPFLW